MVPKCWHGITFVLCCAVLITHVTGSAWLQDPPSRSAAWYYQIKAPVNYDFRNLDCGGAPVAIQQDGTRNCGLCGDPFSGPRPRPNEVGGRYANPRIRTRFYEAGQVADISIYSNLPGSPGFYEFRLCAGAQESQACLDQNLLTIVNHDGTRSSRASVPATQGNNVFHVQLPTGVTCDYCVLQWRFRKENSAAGCDNQNWCGVGRGPQIEFYNCADVMIGAVGTPKPGFIQDPVYSETDYGSAYDWGVTGNNNTTPASSNIDGSGTTARPGAVTPTARPTTARPPIFVIPTAFTTRRPSSSAPQTVPTTRAPLSTTVLPSPETERLITDFGTGAQAGTNFFPASSSNNNNNNGRLLLLLGLLPLLGAFALSNNPRQPAVIPPIAPPGFFVPSIPSMYTGSNFGYGSFGLLPGGVPVLSGFEVQSGSYGNYGSNGAGKYGSGYGNKYGNNHYTAATSYGENYGGNKAVTTGMVNNALFSQTLLANSLTGVNLPSTWQQSSGISNTGFSSGALYNTGGGSQYNVGVLSTGSNGVLPNPGWNAANVGNNGYYSQSALSGQQWNNWDKINSGNMATNLATMVNNNNFAIGGGQTQNFGTSGFVNPSSVPKGQWSGNSVNWNGNGLGGNNGLVSNIAYPQQGHIRGKRGTSGGYQHQQGYGPKNAMQNAGTNPRQFISAPGTQVQQSFGSPQFDPNSPRGGQFPIPGNTENGRVSPYPGQSNMQNGDVPSGQRTNGEVRFFDRNRRPQVHDWYALLMQRMQAQAK